MSGPADPVSDVTDRTPTSQYDGTRPIIASRLLHLKGPGAAAIEVTVNIRLPYGKQHRLGTSWLCDYELFVGGEARVLKADYHPQSSLSSLYGAVVRAVRLLDDLSAEGVLSWPGGGEDISLSGESNREDKEPLAARMFELSVDSYSNAKQMIASYSGTRTPNASAAIDVRLDLREPRFVEGRGWLCDWELSVGGETAIRDTAWGVDSLAAVHGAMAGASADVDDVEGEPEDSWITYAGGAGLLGLLRHGIQDRELVRPTQLRHVIAERVLELHRGDEPALTGFVMARVGCPKSEQQTGGRWSCQYEVTGLGAPFGGRVLGDDSGQALVVCLATVGNLIESRTRLSGFSIRWQRDEHLGFPDMPQRAGVRPEGPARKS